MELYRDDQTSATECSSTEKEHLLEGSSTQRSRRPIIFSLPYIISLFTLINTLLLSFFFVQTLHQPAVPEENQSPNIHNSQALWQPPEHRTSKIFQFDPAYDSDPSAAVEKAWTQLIPSEMNPNILLSEVPFANNSLTLTEGKGYIGLPATMDLPDLAGLNKTWEGNRRAAISVFHQLHCLVGREAPGSPCDEVTIPD